MTGVTWESFAARAQAAFDSIKAIFAPWITAFGVVIDLFKAYWSGGISAVTSYIDKLDPETKATMLKVLASLVSPLSTLFLLFKDIFDKVANYFSESYRKHLITLRLSFSLSLHSLKT